MAPSGRCAARRERSSRSGRSGQAQFGSTQAGERLKGGRADQGVGMALLEIRDVAIRFGGVAALDGLSMAVDEGTVCGLIGPNGAGKTTLFNCVSRLYTPN